MALPDTMQRVVDELAAGAFIQRTPDVGPKGSTLIRVVHRSGLERQLDGRTFRALVRRGVVVQVDQGRWRLSSEWRP